MLELLRASVSGWVAKILIGMLVVSFGVWGIADVFNDRASGAAIAVGDTKVSATEYSQIYRRAVDSMSRQFGTQLTPEQARSLGVETRVIGEVVSGAVLDENARILNLGLSKETLARLIGEDPAFRGMDGNFSRDQFQQAVRQAQMREEDFIVQRNRAAVRMQIFQAVAQGDLIPKVFVDAAATYTSEERKFDYLVLTATNLGIDPKPATTDIEKYFKENKSRYRAPEFRKVAILKVEPEDIVSTIEIDADQVRKDYDSRIDKYSQVERRQVQQIVFSDKEKAEKAVKSLEEGTLFETLLSEMDLKIEDVDLGMLKKRDFPDQKLAEAAFSLELNSTSGVVDGKFGPAILRVTAIEPAIITPFDEVKDQIRKELALAKAADEVINLQDTIEDQRAGGATFKELASANGLKLRVIDAMDASGKLPNGDTIKDLPGSADLLRGIFTAEVGEETDYINVGSAGYAWYDVQSSSPARDRTLDEVKDKVEKDWRTAEIDRLIGERALEMQKSLEEGKTILALASEIGASVQSTGFMKRTDTTPQFNANAVRAGFSGPDGHVAIATGIVPGSKFLLKVAGIKIPDSATLPENERLAVNQSAANDILEQLVGQLRQKYGVQVNENLIRLAQNR